MNACFVGIILCFVLCLVKRAHIVLMFVVRACLCLCLYLRACACVKVGNYCYVENNTNNNVFNVYTRASIHVKPISVCVQQHTTAHSSCSYRII